MDNAPTTDELARARRWAALQDVRMGTSFAGRFFYGMPSWVECSAAFDSADAAWSALALALRPIFASVGPVLFEEAAKVARGFIDNGDYTRDHNSIKSYMDGSDNASRCIADRIMLHARGKLEPHYLADRALNPTPQRGER